MNYLSSLIYNFSLLLFCFLFLQSSYLFLFAAAGRLMSLKKHNHATTTGRFVIYLFVHNKEEIANAVNALQALCFPAEKKHIVVISRTAPPDVLPDLQALQVQWVKADRTDSKIHALQMALQQTKPNFDYALLLDASHICTKGFLYRINDALQGEYDIVQCQRVVKNTTSVFGLLEAISEGVDTHIFCKSQQLLGLSSSLTDSGVGIRFSLLCNMLSRLPDTGHFTRETELYLLRQKIRIGYAPKAFLYEERKGRHVDAGQKYERWSSAKNAALKAYYSACFAELRKGNADFLNKIFQNLLLPRILLLGITPLIVLLSFFNLPVLSSGYWIALWAITYAAIFMSMPAKHINHGFVKAVFVLPLSFVSTARMFFKPKKKRSQGMFSYMF